MGLFAALSGRIVQFGHKTLPITLAAAVLYFGIAPTSPVKHNTASSAIAESPSCFLQTIPHPAATDIARSTVFIATIKPTGELLSEGTGFVVRGSAHDAGPRIVTAAHVIDRSDIPERDALLMVFSSDGVPIGTPRLVAGGTPHTFTSDGFDVIIDDIAVLEIERFADAKIAERFSRIEGLDIENGGSLMVGETDRPLGAVWGFSGAPAIDHDGKVVGVLTEADFRGRASVELASLQETNATNRPTQHTVTLPTQSLVVTEPFNAPQILAALNQRQEYRPPMAPKDVVIAGFPLGSCAATTATLMPLGTMAAISVVNKWQSIGTAGVWYMPVQFSATKLKLVP
jgi:hypothetical protein